MKKVLIGLVLISFLAVLVMPTLVSAQVGALEGCTMSRDVGVDGCPGEGEVCNYEDNAQCGICCLLNTIYNVVDWIFVVLVAIAALFVIIGAITLLTAAGSPEKIKSGRDYIMWAAIGLVVAFLSRAIPAFVKMVVGVV